MEFGVSPFPETGRAMIERGRLFDTPGFRWIPAGVAGQRRIFLCLRGTDAIPETLEWPPTDSCRTITGFPGPAGTGPREGQIFTST